MSDLGSPLSDITFNGSSSLVADSPILIAIRYKGAQLSATVTVGSGDITLKHGAAAAEAVDSTVGVSGVVADGTFTTLGAMVDAINMSPNWQAEIVDGLRSDVSTAALKTLSETTLGPVRTQVLGLFSDTSAKLDISYRISARRDNFNITRRKKRASLTRVRTLVNVGSGTLTLTVLDVDKRSGVSRVLGTWAGVDNTELDTGTTSVNIKSDWGHDLLVRYTTSVDLPDTGAYMVVIGAVEA